MSKIQNCVDCTHALPATNAQEDGDKSQFEATWYCMLTDDAMIIEHPYEGIDVDCPLKLNV